MGKPEVFNQSSQFLPDYNKPVHAIFKGKEEEKKNVYRPTISSDEPAVIAVFKGLQKKISVGV